jgi:hypothetical protein
VLTLKRDLNSAYPNLRLQDLEIVGVRLIAKTRMGAGTATLVVGNEQSNAVTVRGNPQDFENPAGQTFDRVNIRTPGFDSRGVWQIHLNGNFIVRRVAVVVENREDDFFPPPPPPPGPVDRVVTLDCSSLNYQPASCAVNGNIRNARLVVQLSHGRGVCEQGRTWGFSGNTIWVNNGCRGTFEAVLDRW